MPKKKPKEIEHGTIVDDESSPTGKSVYMFGGWHSYPPPMYKKKKVKSKKDVAKERMEEEDKRQQEDDAKRKLEMLAWNAAISEALHNHPSINVIEAGDAFAGEGWALVHIRCMVDIYKNIEMGAGFQPFEKTVRAEIDLIRFLVWSSKSKLPPLANKIKICHILDVKGVDRFVAEGLDYE